MTTKQWNSFTEWHKKTNAKLDGWLSLYPEAMHFVESPTSEICRNSLQNNDLLLFPNNIKVDEIGLQCIVLKPNFEGTMRANVPYQYIKKLKVTNFNFR